MLKFTHTANNTPKVSVIVQTNLHFYDYTGWSKKEDIALQMVPLSAVERFSKNFHF